MNDLLPAVQAVEQIEPAIQAFAEATGVLGPVRELTAWATDLIRYRRAPHQAKLLLRAAEKIKASGLPASAVEDKILRAVLENGPLEDDESMQERWANLLANASTKPGKVRAAFPSILSELDPVEARLLDRMSEKTDPDAFNLPWTDPIPSWVPPGGRDNLIRLRLLREIQEQPQSTLMAAKSPAHVVGYAFTALGWEFVSACRQPSDSR